MQAFATARSTLRLALPDEAATAQLGGALGQAIQVREEAIGRHGLVIGLCGELGSGKTALVRSVLRRLGVTGPVRSPTFSLLELYSVSRLNFYHFDFYRFSKPEEFASSGFRDFFTPGSICAIEWPERAGEALFTIDLQIWMQVADPGRVVQIDALSEIGQDCLQEANRAWRTHQEGAC